VREQDNDAFIKNLNVTGKKKIDFSIFKSKSGNKSISLPHYDYDWVRKYYCDRSVNPDKELFECTYDDTGNLLELYWNNEDIDPHGQESFALWNEPNDQ
jgi:hypothetical protein